MREPRKSRSKANRAVPFQAAFLLFLAGLGTATYFVEFRGVGFATLAAAETAPELVMVGGALLALALVTYLGVSRALATVPGESNVRGILRHALTLADASPEAIEDELETLPSEIQDLVRMLVAQRLRSEGTRREIQSLRHEINSIRQGMQRSALSLEPMRLEGPSEFGHDVATAWNQLLERVRSATLGVGTDTIAKAHTDATSLELQSLRQRLEIMESRCGRLEEDMLSLQTASPSGGETNFGGSQDLILDHSASPSRPSEPAESPWQASVLAGGDTNPEPPAGETPMAGSSGYHEWSGRASGGDWKLNREAQEALTAGVEKQEESGPGFAGSFGHGGADDLVLEPTDSTPPPAQPFVDDTYSLSPEAQEESNPQSSEFAFPHFVGKPKGPTEGRVEVTFEGKRASEAPSPDDELSVDPDGSANRPGSVIFDLRSLGAVELDD